MTEDGVLLLGGGKRRGGGGDGSESDATVSQSSSPEGRGAGAFAAVGMGDESGTESEDDSKRERMFGSIAIPGTAPGCVSFHARSLACRSMWGCMRESFSGITSPICATKRAASSVCGVVDAETPARAAKRQDLSRGPRGVGGGESPHARAVGARSHRLARRVQDRLARPALQTLRAVRALTVVALRRV